MPRRVYYLQGDYATQFLPMQSNASQTILPLWIQSIMPVLMIAMMGTMMLPKVLPAVKDIFAPEKEK